MDEAKGTRSKAVAQQTGDHYDHEDVKGNCSQPLPEGPVRAEERHNEVDDAKLGVWVQEKQCHV